MNSLCTAGTRTACVNNVCTVGRLVFLTSSTVPQNFASGDADGGTAKADTLCQAHANDAGIGGNYRAWLSYLLSSPSTRFTRDGGAWIRINDKALVASTWADLTDATIGSALNYNEKKALVNTGGQVVVLTGTTQSGTSATFSGGQTNTSCNGWTTTSNTFSGTFGDAAQVGFAWSNSANAVCGNLGNARLYCFEQ